MHNLYTNNIYETALNLIEAGVPLFPCRPGLKTPATTNGFHDATTQKDRVSKWFQHTDFNLAIPTGSVSGIIIFDDYGIWGVDGIKKFISSIEIKYSKKFIFIKNYMGQCILIKK